MSTIKPTPAQAAWRKSPRLPAHGRAALKVWNEGPRKDAPVCGAKTKKTGLPCQQPALENGRCRVHGGLTPKGDQWHQPRWPARDSPRFEKKLNRKLADLEKRRLAREARKAAMTPEERARLERWHRLHQPGPAAAREALRAEIRSHEEFRQRMDAPRPAREPTVEESEIAALVERFDRAAAKLDRDELGIFA